jgi:hypothetical protein
MEFCQRLLMTIYDPFSDKNTLWYTVEQTVQPSESKTEHIWKPDKFKFIGQVPKHFLIVCS